ncbi:hypothetical protein ACGFW5_23885 [Streptomyces sp. NPDC048416]|uniref:hypothetical protein n=1 Tax=Streptomyces sp. NPDC048416 TaxID=3365546 RepID=UPI00371CA6EB
MLKIEALPGVPRWAVLAAHAVPLVTLPSGLWRIAQVVGLPVAEQSGRDGREVVLAVSLAVVSEALGLLALGLVRPWGEVAPRWLPFIGGRPVRTLAAVVPALLGAATLCALAGWFALTQAPDLIERVTRTPAQHALLVACYAPLLAWAPLLAATAVAYYRRRTADARRWSGRGTEAALPQLPGGNGALRP